MKKAPREQYREALQQDKKQKHHNVKVYACPICWKQLPDKNEKVCYFAGCKETFEKPEVFDSLIEYQRGQELKFLEKAEKIRLLSHHAWFLVRDAYYWDYQNNGLSFEPFHILKEGLKYNELLENDWRYESDFIYDIKDKMFIEEVKRIDKRTKKPYFTKTQPISHFKLICKLMRLRKKEVHVYAGSQMWWWDSEFKNLEVRG